MPGNVSQWMLPCGQGFLAHSTTLSITTSPSFLLPSVLPLPHLQFTAATELYLGSWDVAQRSMAVGNGLVLSVFRRPTNVTGSWEDLNA